MRREGLTLALVLALLGGAGSLLFFEGGELVRSDEALEAPSRTRRNGLALTWPSGREPNPSVSPSERELDKGSKTPLMEDWDLNEFDEIIDQEEPVAESADTQLTYREEHHENGELSSGGDYRLLSSGEWQRHGRWKTWHMNGQIEELGQYHNGVENGPWAWWTEDGERAAIGQFVDGKREGGWTLWHPNGQKMADAFYKDGDGSGPWTLYFEDGKKMANGNYIEGEIAGYWTFWDEDGNVNSKTTGHYKAGSLVVE